MRTKKKRFGKVLLSLLIVAAISVGAYYYFFIINANNAAPVAESDPPQETAAALARLSDTDDDDNDGLNNWFENYYKTDKDDTDTDGDGLSDYTEAVLLLTDPRKADTDGNGVNDNAEDADGDGLSNVLEIARGMSPVLYDSDFDGLGDYEEFYINNCDPLVSDTDGDGASDGWESARGFNPLISDASYNVTEVAESVDGVSAAEVTVELSAEQAETLQIREITSHYGLNENMSGYIAPAYEFYVYGEIESAEISFEFDEKLLGSRDFDPAIYLFNPDEQSLTEQKTTLSGNTATATVTHFSEYIALNKRYVDTDKPFGSNDTSEYEDVDFDGYTNANDPNPFVWDISDRDLLLCAGIASADLENTNIDNISASEAAGIDSRAFNGYADATIKELRGWQVGGRFNDEILGLAAGGFSATVLRKDNNVVIAFRGTQDFNDMASDALIALVSRSMQDFSAEMLMDSIFNRYKGRDIYLTGHSLGGHLAYRALLKNPSRVVKTATFNGLGLHPVADAASAEKLSKQFGDRITAYKVYGDWVSRLPMSTPGGIINCAQEYYGSDMSVSGPAHSLYNIFNDVTPATRNTRDANKTPPDSPDIPDSPDSSDMPGTPDSPDTSDTPDMPTNPGAGAYGSVDAAPVSASVEITDLSPNSANADELTSFEVTVSYRMENASECIISAGATTDADPDAAVIYTDRTVTETSGEITLNFECAPVRRADNIFVIYVDIAQTGDPSTLDSDAYSIELSGSSFAGEFEIEGKWKQVGENTHGQMQSGSIIIFDGINCNVWSPADKYAFYEDSDGYRLDLTGLLFGTNMSYGVTIIDNDNIEIKLTQADGAASNGASVKLTRV